nr:MAG TPA: hypothetical protein [Caudoviricetes sp.]
MRTVKRWLTTRRSSGGTYGFTAIGSCSDFFE